MKSNSDDYKLAHVMTRFIMIDHRQTSFNMIREAFEKTIGSLQGKLLDDFASFENALNLQWDVIVFNGAYDFDYQKALTLLKEKHKTIPVILLSDSTETSSTSLDILKSGIFDIQSIHAIDHLIFSICRAVSLKRLLRREQQLEIEIDKLQQQTQHLVEHTDQAVAIFQEGVHIFANQEYAQLFGEHEPESFIGQPILDVIQPEDLNMFKHMFKRFSRNDFTQATMQIETRNSASQHKQLHLQFSNTEYEDEPALQMVVVTGQTQTAHHQFSSVEEKSSISQTIVDEQPPVNSLEHPFITPIQLQQQFLQPFQQHSNVALMMFAINDFPHQLLHQGWNSTRDYLQQLQTLLSQQFQQDVFRLSESVFLLIYPVDTSEVLSKIMNELSAHLPKQLKVSDELFALNLKISASVIQQTPALNQINQLLDYGFKNLKLIHQVPEPEPQITQTSATPHPISTDHVSSAVELPVESQAQNLSFESDALSLTQDHSVNFEAPSPIKTNTPAHFAEADAIQFDPTPVKKSTPPTHSAKMSIQEKDEIFFGTPIAEQKVEKSIKLDTAQHNLLDQIENNEIELKFQQLYDKEDIDTHIFEVTATFSLEGQTTQLEDYAELRTNTALAQKADRWVLIEASKSLHKFLDSSPKARIVVNLHAASLQDATLIQLLTKLNSLIHSKYTRPLILQFTEQDMLEHIETIVKLSHASQEKIGFSVCNFGSTDHSEQILQHVPVKFAKLAASFSRSLETDQGIIEIQTKLDRFRAQSSDTQFLIAHLDDMSAFANAWNVDVRYLQGNYFQAKQPILIDQTA